MLEAFNKEVLTLGAVACLPANLSDEWLEWLSIELSFVQNTEKIDHNMSSPSCALAAIFKIILHKNGGIGASISEEELFDKMQEYYTELEIEKMNRWSDTQCDSATLDTIFTGRDVILNYK